MKLIIVDDNYSFRSELIAYLEEELNHDVIAETASGEEFLTLNNLAEADVVLMDVRMEGMDGFQATKEVLKKFFKLKVVALSFDSRNLCIRDLVETGFKGFIDKGNLFSSLDFTLKQVMCGKYVFPKEII